MPRSNRLASLFENFATDYELPYKIDHDDRAAYLGIDVDGA